MRKILTLIICMAAAVSLYANGGAEVPEGSISLSLGGSTTIEPIMTDAIESYLKNIDPYAGLTYQPVGSTAGIRGLLNGIYDIGTSSRDLLINEKEQGAEVINFAQDGIAVITHGDVPIENISLEDLAAIFVGEKKNWKEFGGPDEPIVVVNRDQASGTYGAFEELVLEMVYGDDGRFLRDCIVTSSNGNMTATVSTTPYAIGYGSLAIIDTLVSAGGRVLTVNNIEDTPENIITGKYPIVRPLSFVSYGEPQEDAGKFIDYLLSSAGREIILEAGFVPLK